MARMPIPQRIPRLLAVARTALKEQGSNHYQLAKATGLSIGSVQNLMSHKVSPSLYNIELVLHVLGFEIEVVKVGPPLVKPGRTVTRNPLAKRNRI